jgi:peptidoglycan/LPS O-acetylase OafA/YrhL
MGCLRLLLALSVVAGHSGHFFRSWYLINAKAAVVCFFVISGFYMALVLNEKYTSRVEFMINRWLRIYVPYIVVTLIYGAYLYSAGRLQTEWTGIILNITLIGQDSMRMLNWLPSAHEVLGQDVIVLPQAWTLSVELQLYFIAALSFWRRGGIAASFGIGVALMVFLFFRGYVPIPYAIIPSTEWLAYFAMGGMAYLGYRKVRDWQTVANAVISLAVLGILAGYCWIYNGFVEIPVDIFDWRFLPLYGLTALLLPFLFAATKNVALDRLLGELSYPTYLVHIAVVDAADHIGFPGYERSWFILVVTLALATMMYVAIDQPLEAFRRRKTGSDEPIGYNPRACSR